MKQTTRITIEHIVVASDRSYEQLIEALEAQLGLGIDLDKITRELKTTNATFEQAVQIVEQQLGTSGFTILGKLDQGVLLRLLGKPTRVVQYALGNPLLGIQMIEHAPEVALYAPLRLAVYENRAGNAFVAYDRFTSQLAQYPNPEIAPVAQLVEQKLEELVAKATGGGQERHVDIGGTVGAAQGEDTRRNERQ
jgi:uncharacterized protein (DUF302 family)